MKLPPKTWTPVHEGVAFVREEAEELSKVGLITPDSVKERHQTKIGRVVAVGPEVKQIKAGDRIVIFAQQPTYKIQVLGEDYELINENNIAGVLDAKD